MPLKNSILGPWEDFASDWDEGMGDKGNDYFRFLELPILEKLVERPEGCRALDLATGNGLVARWLAQKAASVIATDGALSMLDRAKARTDSSIYGGKIHYCCLDVTDQASWDSFIADNTDLVVSLGLVYWRIPLADSQSNPCIEWRFRRHYHEYGSDGHSGSGAAGKVSETTAQAKWVVSATLSLQL